MSSPPELDGRGPRRATIVHPAHDEAGIGDRVIPARTYADTTGQTGAARDSSNVGKRVGRSREINANTASAPRAAGDGRGAGGPTDTAGDRADIGNG
ncbi:hypothetical protein, partial [Pandoraea apista]|uniref:hypothetical protein n=1 Tax=Pandoraea apista TaxID=93218 RepID=UPI001C8C58D6